MKWMRLPFTFDEQVAGTEGELDTQRKAWGAMRAKRPFKQCFDVCSSIASCGHRCYRCRRAWYFSFLVVFFFYYAEFFSSYRTRQWRTKYSCSGRCNVITSSLDVVTNRKSDNRSALFRLSTRVSLMKNDSADMPRAIEGFCSPRRPGSYVVLCDKSVCRGAQTSHKCRSHLKNPRLQEGYTASSILRTHMYHGAIQNLIVRATWRPGFVHPCSKMIKNETIEVYQRLSKWLNLLLIPGVE